MRDKFFAFIKEQGLAPGDRLPSERKLASMWGVSQSAVNRAILELSGRGVVHRIGYRLFVGADTKGRPVDLGNVHILHGRGNSALAAGDLISLYGAQASFTRCIEENRYRLALLAILDKGAAGVAIWLERSPDLLAKLQEKGIPCVICGEVASTSYVAPDHNASEELAINYLMSLGHSEIAYFNIPAANSLRKIETQGAIAYERACRKFSLTDSANRVFAPRSADPGEMMKCWRDMMACGQITAILGADERILGPLSTFASKDGIMVPGQLSMMSLRNTPGTARTDPPMTTVDTGGEQAMWRMASFILMDRVKETHAIGRVPDPIQVLLEPKLLIRESTSFPRTRNTFRKQASVGTTSRQRESSRWGLTLKERKKQVQAINVRRFPALGKVACEFLPLNIKQWASRPSNMRHMWLGDEPLLYFPGGVQEIHGITYSVPHEQNGAASCIVLRSARSHSSKHHRLPEYVKVPVDCKVLGISFLHTCGWATQNMPFAQYELILSDGRTEVAPIIPLGPVSRGASQGAADANIQDWHPSAPVLCADHALPYLITQEDPLEYERYLYSYLWLNPDRSLKVRSIGIRTLYPDSATTLAVLGVTLILPSPFEDRQ